MCLHEYLDDELAAFPYVNGGLFADENIIIPKITEGIKQALLESALFNWADISPTILGAVFESTLNPETRRSGGMHYTSIENIHKVIGLLFLNELKEELATIKAETNPRTKKQKLEQCQNKLASMTWLEKTLPTLIQTNETKESTQIDALFELKPKIDAFLKIDANVQRQEYKMAS